MMLNNLRVSKRLVLSGLFLAILVSVVFVLGCSQKTPIPEENANTNASNQPVKPVELNMGHFMPPMHPLHVQVLEPFAKEVAEKTEGRVKIFIYPGNELVGAAENYDAVVSGVIDIGFSLPAYTPGRFPLTEIMEFPFMFSSPVQANLTMTELMETHPAFKETEYNDVQVLWYGTGDLGHFLTTKPLKTIENLKGLKVRSPSKVNNDVITALGAVPVTMPVSETYDAIERGIVDGTLLPISTLISFRLSEVIDHVLEVNMYATPFHLVMNKSSWNKISPGDQKIISELLKAFPEKIGNLYTEETEKGYKRAEEAGIPIQTLSAEEMQKFRQTLEPLIEKWIKEMEAKGLPAREVYEQARKLADKYQ